MRHQHELEIDLPRERVLDLFLDPESLLKWQPGLISLEQIGEGQPRHVGTKTKQIHEMGGREVEVIETITAHDYPDTFSATYESDGVWNLIENHFSELGERKTKWVLTAEFKFSNIFLRLMTVVMPGMFKKQTLTFMNHFKEFAERSENG